MGVEAVWGRTHNTSTHANRNAWLAETAKPIRGRNWIIARAELADKGELFESSSALAGIRFRILALTAGYTREIARYGVLRVGLGANPSTYEIPSPIRTEYSSHPIGGAVFLRFRLTE